MAFRSIFVPLDGSPFGEYALPYALALARSAKAKLELAHVYESSSFSELSLATAIRHDKEALEKGRAYLADVERRVKAAVPAAEVASTLLQGWVGEALCDFIGRTKPDLVVLTTHGRGPLSRFWLGSVATELVQCSPIPMLLVRPKEGPPDLAAVSAPRRILIPLDGSRFGERIIPVAAAVGEVMGAEYRLLRVVPPVLSSSGGGLGELGAGTATVADQRPGRGGCLHRRAHRAHPRADRRRDQRRGRLAAGRRHPGRRGRKRRRYDRTGDAGPQRVDEAVTRKRRGQGTARGDRSGPTATPGRRSRGVT